jgi:hypothetical protein
VQAEEIAVDPDDTEVGVNDAGLGVTVGDWQIGGTWAGSTDDRYDTPETRQRAEQHDQDAREAQRRGEQMPNPVHDLLHPPTPPDLRQDPVTRAIQQANADAKPQLPLVIHDPLTGNPVVVHAPPDQDSSSPADHSEPGDYPMPADDPAMG